MKMFCGAGIGNGEGREYRQAHDNLRSTVRLASNDHDAVTGNFIVMNRFSIPEANSAWSLIINVMIVTLIGYRGSGKSSVAPLLAARWGWAWIDADVELERRAQRSIREIFAIDGEATFRHMEQELLAELLQRNRLVIAAGGGAVLNADTRRAMSAAGPVVWLQADVETISRRLADDAHTAARRPNLTAQGGAAEIAAVLAARQPLYTEVATLHVPTDGRGPSEIAAEIGAALLDQVVGAKAAAP